MKKILIIGAGDYQVPAIKRVRQMGYAAYCVDYKEGQPGFEYANGYKIIDVKDKEACLAYAQELSIDGVLTWGATLTLPTVSYIGERMNLPCMPMATSEISMSKYQIRKALDDFGLNSAGRTFELNSQEEAKNREYSLPFVVKPTDGSGSKGVCIVKESSEIENAIQYAFEGARNNQIYVEPYIDGEEFTVEAYVCNGKCYIYSIVKTEFYWTENYPIYKQTTYLGITPEVEQAITLEVEKAVKALNVTWGPINFDLIVSADNNKPYIIDVGIRNGQNLIASHIVPYSRGVDELDNSINLCLGIETDAIPKKKKYISSRLLIYNPGVIKHIKDVNQVIGTNNIVDIIMRKKEGDILPPYQTKSDICGWVLTEGNTPDAASQYADAAWETLQNYIIIE